MLGAQVFSNTILQQVFVVEFVVQNQMCPDCHRVMAKDTWNAVVQVRQKVWPGCRCSVCVCVYWWFCVLTGDGSPLR